MALEPWTIEPGPDFCFHADTVELSTCDPLEFLDITSRVIECVRRSGVTHGLVNVQTRHTTTAILVNENEPCLIADLADHFARLAPREARYRHDQFESRPTAVPPDERPNAHAHLRSVLLAPSATLNIVDGEVQLGPWQRIFLVELDGGRDRTVSIGVLGVSETGRAEESERAIRVACASAGRDG